MKHRRLFHGILVFLFCGVSAYAQGSPQFDAATVKLLPNGFSTAMEGGPGTHDPGRATWQRAWLLQLLAKAFHVDNLRDITGPDWIGGNGRPVYAFTATMPSDTSRHDFELMLQKFLIEQFKITLHHEPKASPAYDLVIAPGGPKLKASADQSDPTAPDRHYGIPEMGSDGFAILPPGRGSTIASGPKGMHAIFQQYSISEFAEYLRGFVMTQGDRTPYIVDKTGIAGRYDLKVKFDNRESAIRVGPDVQAALSAQDPLGPGSGLPTIFKALEQQLGLRLVKTKDILVDTIVIDHAEQMPVGN
jgi:uncharacterized protein (TIGR03435 family)